MSKRSKKQIIPQEENTVRIKRHSLMTISAPFVYIILGIVITALSILVYTNYNTKSQLQQLVSKTNEELQRANLELGRAQTKVADAAVLVNQLNISIQEEIKKRQAVVTMYAKLEANYKAEQKKVKIVTQFVYKDRELPIPKGKLFVQESDGKFTQVDSVKFNYKDFRISITGDALKEELSYSLNQKFRAIFAESKLPTGGFNHYAEIYEVGPDGKDVGKVALTDFKVVKSETLKAKMWWWNPKLDIAVHYMVSGTKDLLSHGPAGELGFSFSSYGTTPDDISWRFFRLAGGIRHGAHPTLTFGPAQYNIGKVLPLISNLWITPVVGSDLTEKSWLVGGGLGAVF